LRIGKMLKNLAEEILRNLRERRIFMMHRTRLAASGFFVWMLAYAQVSGSSGISSAITLNQMRDRLRPLLIFAPTADDARLLDQVRSVETHSVEAADRDLVPITVLESGISENGYRLADQDVIAARRRFHAARGEFVVVLVGKDGGEKLRSRKPLAFETLRSVIDAMPMRQEEMRAKGF